ncbi:MAG: hypothetical protein M3Y82_00225 [Verrucomicrobiota bacterium]|nr:hypothetical protein [Verrucomicrobiota bacterium]
MAKKNNLRNKLTHQEQRELNVEIEFMEGIVRRAPEYVEALQILGDDYTRRGSIAEGLKVDQQLAQLRPEDPLICYNLACSYSLAKKYALAVGALERAFQFGYRNFKWMAKDPDLKNLRSSPLYETIRAKLRDLQKMRL